jgi:hypothetical protein
VATTDSAPGARNTDYAQALALAGLLAGASLSLSRLYAGNAWLLPTWLTMAAALGLAALLRRLGVGQLLALLAMVGGFLVVGGILLFPDTLLLVVPTGRTLSEMAAAASTALTAVSEQAAPVQVTTEFVLLTCAGAWAVATAADGLAFRPSSPPSGCSSSRPSSGPPAPPGTRPGSCSAPPGCCCSRAGPGWPPGAAGCRAPAAGPAPAGGCR